MEYEVVPLHKHKHHTDTCADILNAEWPRSQAAREHSLGKSCDGLPCTLVFRRKSDHEVVGSSRLVAVQGKDRACLLESVIIRKDLRGKGLGRKLMEQTEEFSRGKSFKTVYLNTVDKQEFYTHLGYIECSPVTSLGDNAHRVPEHLLQKLLGTSLQSSDDDTESTQSIKAMIQVKDVNKNAASAAASLAPPPPSPSAPPPPPPPPPAAAAPPAPPLPLSKSVSSSAQSRHVKRMDPNAHTWMKKSLHCSL